MPIISNSDAKFWLIVLIAHELFFASIIFKGLYGLQSDLDALNQSLSTQAPIVSPRASQPAKTPIVEPTAGTIREVSAYNAGDEDQTDGDPCIAANGEDICEALARGEKHCAANFVPLNSFLDIDHFGRCKVSDRLASRYENTVDVAMQAHEKERALKFGRQKLLVKIVK